MNLNEMETMIKTLQAQVQELQAQARLTQDIEQIKRLQRIYGYYLDNFMTDEIVDLFSDSPDTILILNAGKFHGKEGVKRFFRSRPDRSRRIPKFHHQVMQLSPVIDVAPDGLSAKGRWYGFGPIATPLQTGVHQGWMNGVYSNEYVKENGVWKIKKLRWWMYFFAPYSQGWVERDQQCDPAFRMSPPQAGPDEPAEDTVYPSTYICPFHFTHPVTNRIVTVAEEVK
jgi:hypothetical protein